VQFVGTLPELKFKANVTYLGAHTRLDILTVFCAGNVVSIPVQATYVCSLCCLVGHLPQVGLNGPFVIPEYNLETWVFEVSPGLDGTVARRISSEKQV
jgi:hypothetical protein